MNSNEKLIWAAAFAHACDPNNGRSLGMCLQADHAVETYRRYLAFAQREVALVAGGPKETADGVELRNKLILEFAGLK